MFFRLHRSRILLFYQIEVVGNRLNNRPRKLLAMHSRGGILRQNTPATCCILDLNLPSLFEKGRSEGVVVL